MKTECRNCQAWETHGGIEPYGYCHRYPPDGPTAPHFPQTHKTGWCFDGIPREAGEKERDE